MQACGVNTSQGRRVWHGHLHPADQDRCQSRGCSTNEMDEIPEQQHSAADAEQQRCTPAVETSQGRNKPRRKDLVGKLSSCNTRQQLGQNMLTPSVESTIEAVAEGSSAAVVQACGVKTSQGRRIWQRQFHPAVQDSKQRKSCSTCTKFLEHSIRAAAQRSWC